MAAEQHQLTVYMVDRDLPGITLEELAASQQFTTEGRAVRYLRNMFIPGEARCICLFEADDEAVVVAVNEAARLPFTRIVAALDLTPPYAAQ